MCRDRLRAGGRLAGGAIKDDSLNHLLRHLEKLSIRVKFSCGRQTGDHRTQGFELASQFAGRRIVPEPMSTKPERLKVVDSAELFAGETEIVIVHNGVPYRLRITRQGKLILTK